jgi:hypothetical protein
VFAETIFRTIFGKTFGVSFAKTNSETPKKMLCCGN